MRPPHTTKSDIRRVIVLDGERLHDIVDEILRDIIPRNEIRQTLEGGLRDAGGLITAARMQKYLTAHLRFWKDGAEIEPPISLMKFVVARWRSFPERPVGKYSK